MGSRRCGADRRRILPVEEIGGIMYAGFGAVDDEKVKTTQNIITLVRAAQKNKVAINYDALIKSVEATFGANHPEVTEVRALLKSLQSTNPY